MKKTALIVPILLSCAVLCANAKTTFVLYDKFLNLPALCFRLDEGWQGMGWINWNIRGDTKFEMSTILMSPSRHMLYQETGPSASEALIFYPQVLARFQDPSIFASHMAWVLNSGIVVDSLSSFRVTGAKWTDEVPEWAPVLARAMQSANSRVSIFGFEGNFECFYAGQTCDAVLKMTVAVNMLPQVRPTMPAFGTALYLNPKLVISPKGRMQETLKECGRQMASLFYNNRWCVQRDRTFGALIQGTIKGRNEGYADWLKTQEETSAMLDRVRRSRSEMIREVKTVDNPLSPGNKIERPAFFDNAWVNGATEQMLLSDRNLEPNTIRPLMEQGEWIAIE